VITALTGTGPLTEEQGSLTGLQPNAVCLQKPPFARRLIPAQMWAGMQGLCGTRMRR
jgi:hypothetical protein